MAHKAEWKSSYEVFEPGEALPDMASRMLDYAQRHMDLAYSPYSNFKVACTVLGANNEMVCGTNQENASYPVGLCAERVALPSFVSLYPIVQMQHILIHTKSVAGQNHEPCAPCGLCRQTILEYENRQRAAIEIWLAGENGKMLHFKSVKDILPFPFSSF